MSRRALARGIAVPRLRSQPGVLAAVVLSVLVATTLLATGPVLSTALAEAGLRARLEQSPPRDVGVEVEVRTRASTAEQAADGTVLALRRGLGELVTVPDVFVRTGTVGLADGPDELVVPVGRIVEPSALETADRRAPEPLLEQEPTSGVRVAADEVPVLVHAGALERLDVAPGERIALDSGATAVVTGVLRAADAADRRWWDEPLWRDGLDVGERFTTVGPLVTTSPSDLGELLGEEDPRIVVTVRALPEVDAIRPDTLAEIGVRARSLDDRVAAALDPVLGASADTWSVEAPIIETARESAVQLGSTRAAVLATVAQVAVLALYTLGLSGRLLRSGREVETMLVRARGATPRQLGWAALVEGAVVVVPTLLLAPFAATLVTRALGRLEVVAGAGLTLLPRPSWAALGAAAVAAVACLALLVWPAVTSARRTYASTRGAQGRRRAVTFVQASGLDLALVALAAIGVWQLRAAGAPVAGGSGGGDRVDLVLVAAPALGLLAGALLVLRLVPVIARLAEHVVDDRRGLVGSLSGWQIARRPDVIARPTLLLALAVAIGVLVTTYATTWSVSQDDQAAAAVGAEGTAEVDRSAGSLPSTDVALTIAGLDAVERVGPSWTNRVRLPGDRATGSLIAIGADDPLLLARDDRAPTVPYGDLDVAPVRGSPVPAGDTLTVRAVVEEDDDWPEAPARIVVVVRDGHGLIHQLPHREVVTGDDAELSWDVGRLRRPAALVGVEVTGFAAPADAAGSAVAPAGTDDDGVLRSIPPPRLALRLTGWAVDGEGIDLSTVDWSGDPLEQSGPSLIAPEVESIAVRDGDVLVRVVTGYSSPAGRNVLARLATGTEDTDPGVVASALVGPDVLAATGREVGDRFEVVVSGARLPLELAGTIPVVPGAVDAQLPVVVDIDAVARARWQQQRSPTPADQWQLDVVGPAAGGAGRASIDASRTLAAQLGGGEIRAPEVSTTVLDAASRSADPIAVGLLVALALGALAAVLLALLGTVTAAAVSVRERAAEFALLQAVGTSMRQIRSWLASEVAVVVVTGLVAGSLLGAVLVWAVLPTLGLATDGSLAVPAPRIVVPVRTLLASAGIVVAAFALVPLGLARSVARAHVAEVLRLGGEV